MSLVIHSHLQLNEHLDKSLKTTNNKCMEYKTFCLVVSNENNKTISLLL
jgi:hypothetical protein